MKYIIKSTEPQSIIDWKNLANDDWQPSWDNLMNPQKGTLRESLVEEQGYICCYCQQRIDTSTRTEIEHIITREECTRLGNEALKITYTNLIASCEGNRPPSRHVEIDKDRHCNNFRSNRSLLISPLDINCEDEFFYDFQGVMHGKTHNATITIENLNLKVLKDYRKAKITGVFYEADGITPIIFATEEKDQLFSYYQNKSNIDGDNKMKFPEFAAVIINVLNQLP